MFSCNVASPDLLYVRAAAEPPKGKATDVTDDPSLADDVFVWPPLETTIALKSEAIALVPPKPA